MPRPRKKVKRRSKKKAQSSLDLRDSTRSAISGTVQVCLGILFFLVLQNKAGSVGNAVNELIVFFFGRYGVIFPMFLIVSGALHVLAPTKRMEVTRSTGLILCLLSFLGLMHINVDISEIGTKRDELAGAIGFMVSLPFLAYFSRAVGITVLAATFLVGVFIAFEPDVGGFARMVMDTMLPSRRKKRERLLIERDIKQVEIEPDEEEEQHREHAERAEEQGVAQFGTMADALEDAVPGEGDGVFFEVVAEAEVAQHLEKGVMACGVADVFQVVVLSSRANTLLGGRGARVGAFFLSEEHVFELVAISQV
jgi:hypothetical protein